MKFFTQISTVVAKKRPARSYGQKILLTPGPVAVHRRVSAAIAKGLHLHHRSCEFSQLLEEVITKYNQLFQVPNTFQTLIYGGSGTAMNEAMLCSLAAAGQGHILILYNGDFGKRLIAMCQKLKLPFMCCPLTGDTNEDTQQIEDILRQNDIGAVAYVHHETSNGRLNNLSWLKDFKIKYRLLIGIDAISSIAGEVFDFDRLAPDLVVTSSGKAIGAFAGLGILSIKRSVLAKLQDQPVATHYLCPGKVAAAYNQNRMTPFTPPTLLFYPFLEALNVLENHGLENIMKRKRLQLERLNEALEVLGFQRFDEGECSQITATYHYSEEQQKTFDTLMRYLKAGNIHLLQNPISQRPQRVFQCSTMGWISGQQLEMTVNRINRLGGKLYSV